MVGRGRGRRASKLRKKNDYFSELPDDVLSKITSYLDIKDVVRTSILSGRWRHIWLNYADLKFNHFDILGLHYNELKENWIGADNMFVKSVDQIMEQRIKGSSINSFCLNFQLGKNFSQSIDHWIKCAVINGVKTLDLDFSKFSFNLYPTYRSQKRFRRYDFSLLKTASENKGSLKHLRIVFCNFRGRSSSQKFASLVSLQLEKVNISDIQLTKVLESCPSLEKLHLRSCPNFSYLKTGCGINNSLKILSLDDIHLRGIDFCANNLISLELQRVQLSPVFELMKFIKGCPMLEELTLHKCLRLTKLNICDSHNPRLKILSLRKCFNLTEIELCVNNLHTFDYISHSRIFSFKLQASRLVNAFISERNDLNYTVAKLCLDIPTLENLVLWMDLSLQSFKLEDNSLHEFPNMRRLVLRDFLFVNNNNKISMVCYIWKCFPFLQTLELNINKEDPLYEMQSKEREKKKKKEEEEVLEICPNSTITKLELNGFLGYKQHHLDLLIYLLKNLTGLKVLAIGPACKQYKSFQGWYHSEPNRWGKRWFLHESEWFRTVVPPSVHIEFLENGSL